MIKAPNVPLKDTTTPFLSTITRCHVQETMHFHQNLYRPFLASFKRSNSGLLL